ncbi:ligand-binding sensor protein [Anaerobacterium chartisolvens]|uniref:Ligand-binding sensor protein n=1 Tax=Anaerobacterium chartisolvens TaxID=1297424 RepID=A0A369AG65_9FIRM|nr:PocR ligand-binding domain-containing protein [Anaerobacterium chartisolvens]RCX07348.1 ligand-binding sensor protein [Anaerobacterium chartisolvens]
MKKVHSSLNNVLDLEKWQRLQDSLAVAAKMAIITIDYKGIPITDHSSCCDFCSQVRQDPKFLPYCLKCDSRAGLEAVRTNKPYIYFCHFDIIDVAIPIIIDDKYLGAVMAGQVKLPPNEITEGLERMSYISDSKQASNKLSLLRNEYEAIPTLSYEQVKSVSEMLFQLCNYIIEAALEKQLAIDMYSSVTQDDRISSRSEKIVGYGVENIKKIKKEMSDTLIDAYILGTFDKKITIFSPLLRPAIEYIFMHKSEKISLKTVSEICHISPSYFSRMFYKETGEYFSKYLVKLKVMFAKDLLEKTEMPINQISESLGFDEVSYFIKKFKIQTGVTPLVYKKNLPK